MIDEWASALGSNAWSPDEDWIVFSKLQPNGDLALWKVNINSNPPMEVPLTFGYHDTSAAWSPDSKTIAFSRNGELMTVPAEGGTVSSVGVRGGSPAWLPDSSGLVYTNGDLWEVRFGSAPRRIRPGSDTEGILTASVSSDGDIAYSTYGHDVNVYWAPLYPGRNDDSKDDQVTMSTNEQFAPRVSPVDDTKVLYASNRSDYYRLYVTDRRINDTQQLIPDPIPAKPFADRLPDWSPNAKKIVFVSDRDGTGPSRNNLWILYTETKTWKQLTFQTLSRLEHPGEAEGGPRWSPDDKLIAYLAPDGDKGNAIWVVGEDGSDPHSTGILGATSFSWYKDSDRLIYTRQAHDGSGRQDLVAYNLRTTDEENRLTDAIAEVAVSQDGSQLSLIKAVSHFTMNLFAVDLKEGPHKLPELKGSLRQITFGKGWHVHAGGFSKDGKGVVYSQDRDHGNIYIMERIKKK